MFRPCGCVVFSVWMIENSGEVYLATVPKNPLASNDVVFTSSIYELVLTFSICFESKFNVPI